MIYYHVFCGLIFPLFCSYFTLTIIIFNNNITLQFSLKFRNFVGLNFIMKVFSIQC